MFLLFVFLALSVGSRADPELPDSFKGIIVVGFENGNVQGLNARSGEEVWMHEHSEDTAEIRAIGTAEDYSSVYFTTSTNKLVSLKRSSGNVEWSQTVEVADTMVPTADADFVYLTTTGGEVQARSTSNGDVMWSHQTNCTLSHGPLVIAGGYAVLIACDDGEIKVIETQKGGSSESSSHELASFDAGHALAALPVVSDDGSTLYVVTANGASSTVFGLSLSFPAHAPPFMHHNVSFSQLFSASPLDGSPSGPPVVNEYDVVENSQRVTARQLVLATQAGKVFVLDASTGGVTHSFAHAGTMSSAHGRLAWTATAVRDVNAGDTNLTIPDGTVLQGSKQGHVAVAENAEKRMFWFDALSGDVIDAGRNASFVSLPGTVTGDLLHLPHNPIQTRKDWEDRLKAIEDNMQAGNSHAWLVSPPSLMPQRAAVNGSAAVCFVTDDTEPDDVAGMVMCRDGATGRMLWHAALSAKPVAGPLFLPIVPQKGSAETREDADSFAKRRTLHAAIGGLLTFITAGILYLWVAIRLEKSTRTRFSGGGWQCADRSDLSGAIEVHFHRLRILMWTTFALCLFVLAYEWWWVFVGLPFLALAHFGLEHGDADLIVLLGLNQLWWAAAGVVQIIDQADHISLCDSFGDECGDACGWCEFIKISVLFALLLAIVGIVGAFESAVVLQQLRVLRTDNTVPEPYARWQGIKHFWSWVRTLSPAPIPTMLPIEGDSSAGAAGRHQRMAPESV